MKGNLYIISDYLENYDVSTVFSNEMISKSSNCNVETYSFVSYRKAKGLVYDSNEEYKFKTEINIIDNKLIFSCDCLCPYCYHSYALFSYLKTKISSLSSVSVPQSNVMLKLLTNNASSKFVLNDDNIKTFEYNINYLLQIFKFLLKYSQIQDVLTFYYNIRNVFDSIKEYHNRQKTYNKYFRSFYVSMVNYTLSSNSVIKYISNSLNDLDTYVFINNFLNDIPVFIEMIEVTHNLDKYKLLVDISINIKKYFDKLYKGVFKFDCLNYSNLELFYLLALNNEEAIKFCENHIRINAVRNMYINYLVMHNKMDKINSIIKEYPSSNFNSIISINFTNSDYEKKKQMLPSIIEMIRNQVISYSVIKEVLMFVKKDLQDYYLYYQILVYLYLSLNIKYIKDIENDFTESELINYLLRDNSYILENFDDYYNRFNNYYMYSVYIMIYDVVTKVTIINEMEYDKIKFLAALLIKCEFGYHYLVLILNYLEKNVKGIYSRNFINEFLKGVK